MFNDDYVTLLTKRAQSIVDAETHTKSKELQTKINEIKNLMVKNGVFYSSAHVNEIYRVVVETYIEIADSCWRAIQSSHKSTGSKTYSKIKQDFYTIYSELLTTEKLKLEFVAEIATKTISGLQNNNLQLNLMADENVKLISKYQVEIDMYLDNLKYSKGNTKLERTINGFMDMWVVAIGKPIFAFIIFLAAVFGAIEFISKSFNAILS